MLPTYEIGEEEKNPIFLEKRVYQGSCGAVYPYPVVEKISDKKADKKYHALFIENEYIKVMVLPELGGRIHMAYDKVKKRHFVYYNQVVKPALVGLTGPWISGGIEFNWPQHHRPSTFLPTDFLIEENADGSKTIWCNEVERMFRTKGMQGFTLYPGKAYIEIKVKIYNRTSFPQTFLWWANPAVVVNDHYHSVFPPDVNAVFDHSAMYAGFVVFTAGALYSLQLYADFMACVSMARGAAALFGVQLAENFNHPYLALSVKEFWQRWHISLSSWLRDYIYIPLGGNRKGRMRRYINLALTFAVSGVWHGAGYKYLFWGLFHAAYQIGEEITAPVRDRLCRLLGISGDSLLRTVLRRAATLFPVMAAWIVFRADSLREGLRMLFSMVSVWNPWILFDDTLLRLGLEWKEWAVLLISSWVLLRASLLKERRGLELWDWLMRQHILFRWFCYLGAAVAVFVFGTYGFGFDAQAFIYGGF